MGNVRLSFTNDPSSPGTPTIIEENNYYPFGLEHKGYNEGGDTALGSDTAQKWKYNGTELEESLGLDLYEMPLRNYDPAIARWMSIDPVTHYSASTYNAFDNNPSFWADPSGADATEFVMNYFNKSGNGTTKWTNLNSNFDDSSEGNSSESPQDDITVNSKGIVISVVENNQPNRFFDQQGNELKFNDPNGVDGMYMPEQWLVGDRLFIPVSTEQMNNAIAEKGLIWQRWSASMNIAGSGPGYWIWSMFAAADKGHGDFDFAEQYLDTLIEDPSFNFERNRSRTTYNDGSGFFRFGNTNNIYNLYDAGNYMWGRAMSLSGFTSGEARFGSQANELFRDKDADQRAIKNGFDGN